MNKRIGALLAGRRSHLKSELGRLWSQLRRLAREDSGVSAVEFALLAQMILVPALLATVDVGRALTESMAMGHVLRAGAQSATADGDDAAITQVLRATAAKNFTVAAPGVAGDDTSLALKVNLNCACAEQPGTPVDCWTTCPGPAPTQIFYALTAEKTYSGLLLHGLDLSRELKVQVR